MALLGVLLMALSLLTAMKKVQAKPTEPTLTNNHENSTVEEPGWNKEEAQRLRLVDGGSTCSGRVEVEDVGVWSTVCADDWDLAEAKVVCQKLGCGQAVRALNSSYFQNGTGPIHLNKVKCSWNESYLWNCSSVRNQDCEHQDVASVECSGSQSLPDPTDTLGPEVVTSNSHVLTTHKCLSEAAIPLYQALRILCLILGLLFLIMLLTLIIVLLNRRWKHGTLARTVSSGSIATPVLMNHSITAGVSNDYREFPTIPAKGEATAATLAPSTEDSDSDYEHYDFNSNPPVSLSTTTYTANKDLPPCHIPMPVIHKESESKHPATVRYLQKGPPAEDSSSTSSGELWYEKNTQKQKQQGIHLENPPSVQGLTTLPGLLVNSKARRSSSDSSDYDNMRPPAH